MKIKRFFAGMAKSTFAFAAVLTMSFALTACSGSDEDDGTDAGGTNPTTEIPKEAKPNTVVIDGVEKPVLSTKLEGKGDNTFCLYLYLSADKNEFVEVIGDATKHIGKTIDLSKLDEKTTEYSWSVSWIKGVKSIFNGWGGDASFLFKTGTMTTSVNLGTGEVDLTISGGKVQTEEGEFGDGQEHTVALKWKGIPEMNEKPETGGGGSTTLNQLVLDGVKKTVLSVELEDKGKNDYILYLYLSADKKEFILINGNMLRHNGKTISLTKPETHSGNYRWLVAWKKGDNYKFCGIGVLQFLFKTGTMTINVNVSKGEVDVAINNGKIRSEKGTQGDGKEHTISLKWKGKVKMKKPEMGGSGETKTGQLILDGTERQVLSTELRDWGKNDYSLRFYLSEDKEEYVQIAGNTKFHNGKSIDLTKPGEDTADGGWSISWVKKSGNQFYSWGKSDEKLFKTGTMNATINFGRSDADVTINNGKIIYDDKEHTISLKWKGIVKKI